MYMSKLIVGPGARGNIDIDAPVPENIEAIARALGRRPQEITVAVLDRDRHESLIEEIRKTGARIQIRPEGDLTPAIAVGMRGADLHAIIGIGGAPEGILAAAVMKCLGGEMQARMWPTQRSQVEKLIGYGLDRKVGFWPFTPERVVDAQDPWVALWRPEASLLVEALLAQHSHPSGYRHSLQLPAEGLRGERVGSLRVPGTFEPRHLQRDALGHGGIFHGS